MHRLGLSETLLLFPEHRAFFSADADWCAAVDALGRDLPEKKRVVEVTDAAAALAMARRGVEVLQLERFSPSDVAALRKQLRAAGLSPLLAPAGGVTAANAVAYAQAGADLLVSSAPYSAPPTDVKVTLVPSTGLALTRGCGHNRAVVPSDRRKP